MIASRLSALVLCLTFAACATSAPPRLQAEIDRSPPGTATVVFLTDFQCPFCRRTHAALEAAIAQREGKVRVVLVHVPLRSHPDARTAAKASICAEAQGIDLSHALATAPDLSASSCERLATSAGANADVYRDCVAAVATEQRIASDDAFYDGIQGDGVPILFVGKQRLEGQQSAETLLVAIDRAIAASR